MFHLCRTKVHRQKCDFFTIFETENKYLHQNRISIWKNARFLLLWYGWNSMSVQLKNSTHTKTEHTTIEKKNRCIIIQATFIFSFHCSSGFSSIWCVGRFFFRLDWDVQATNRANRKPIKKRIRVWRLTEATAGSQIPTLACDAEQCNKSSTPNGKRERSYAGSERHCSEAGSVIIESATNSIQLQSLIRKATQTECWIQIRSMQLTTVQCSIRPACEPNCCYVRSWLYARFTVLILRRTNSRNLCFQSRTKSETESIVPHIGSV